MNSKFKCAYCSKYQKNGTGFKNIIGNFCNKKCGYNHYIKSKNRNNKKTKRSSKNLDNTNNLRVKDIKTRKIAARLYCHKYINLRDAGKPCICCGKPDTQHAGHFIKAGSSSFLRYHEDNIHAQNCYCNLEEGGDSGNYEANLRLKIGDKRVDWLLDNRSRIIKRSAEDYYEIEKYYREKIKCLERMS